MVRLQKSAFYPAAYLHNSYKICAFPNCIPHSSKTNSLACNGQGKWLKFFRTYISIKITSESMNRNPRSWHVYFKSFEDAFEKTCKIFNIFNWTQFWSLVFYFNIYIAIINNKLWEKINFKQQWNFVLMHFGIFEIQRIEKLEFDC